MRYSPGGEMNNDRYEKIKLDRFEARLKMAGGKAKEYAKDNDRLANFKEAAAILGIHPLTVASVYFYKHVAAVLTFCRKTADGVTPELSEPIEGRVQDAQEYLDIIAALIEDTQ
jgi:DNA-binding transcriptional regulator YhcF (GntR family)